MLARYVADGTVASREFDKLGRDAERMSERVKRGANAMSPALKGIDAAAGVAQQKLQGLAGSAGSLGTVLTAMGPAGLAAAAGLGALSLAFVGLQRAALDAMRQIADIDGVANQLGVATDFVQEFRFAVTGTGGDISIADSALLSFSRNLGQLNTELGKRAKGALEELGFSDEEIANMRNVEQALPRIIARISQVGDASAQAAIAQKLGLDGVLETLQAGGDGFEALRAQARATGFVLDRELIQRAAEMEDQWKLAELQIGTNFRAALVELAPAFVDLAKAIAGASRGLSEFLDIFKEIELRGRRSVERELARTMQERQRLIDAFGREQLESGNHIFSGAFADLTERQERLVRRFNELAFQQPSRLPTTTRPDEPGDRSSTSVDAALNQMRQFVAQLEEEARVRQRLGELRAQNAKATDDELRATLQLEDDLRKLTEAREAGIITSDEELARLEALRRGRDAETAAVRAQQAELQRLEQIRAANDNLRTQIETPQQRILREIGELEAGANKGGLDPTLVAARVRQLREEYRELAAAQYEASLQGRVLAGVIQQQIQDFDDLARTLVGIFTDATLREVMAGGLGGEGGFTGFLGRVAERAGVGGLLGGDGSGGGADALNKAAQEAATSLAESLTPGIVDAGAKLLISTTTTVRETQVKAGATVATTQFAAAVRAAAAAAQAFASAAGGGGGKGILGSLVQAVAGGGKGGGKAGGGSLLLGAGHPVTEMGPELGLLWGPGHVAPTAAVEGLAVLSRIARMPLPANTNTAPPQVHVNIINETGVPVDVRSEARFADDGSVIIDTALTRKTASDVASGKLDDAARQRWNVRPPMTRRG